MAIIIMLVVFAALMYFMSVRPQKKRAETQRKLIEEMAPGTRVLIHSGFFGTVRAMGTKQVVIELAPGTEVTALKEVIVRVANPDEEEFEFTDSESLEGSTDQVDADALPADASNAYFQPPMEEGKSADTEIAAPETIESSPADPDSAGDRGPAQPNANEESTSDTAGERPQGI